MDGATTSLDRLSSARRISVDGGDFATIRDIKPIQAIHPRLRVSAHRNGRRRPLGGATKRCFDILVSSVALILLSPLLLIVMAAIALESRGPIFFLQRRGGLWGETFLVFKFRTMTSVDDGKVIAQAVKNDPRTTRIGAVLRAMSIDELPQLLNVLRGEMSIVGPRPHAVAHDNTFQSIDPRYRARRRARPGITGLAQVSGSRGLTLDAESVSRRVDFDIKYLSKWSMFLDMWIIVRTALLVLHDPRAH